MFLNIVRTVQSLVVSFIYALLSYRVRVVDTLLCVFEALTQTDVCHNSIYKQGKWQRVLQA